MQVLARLPAVTDPRALAGRGEDACAYRLDEHLAVVQTVDFITPVVDDPRSFGAVAAANALSDIYAMGAAPLFAANVVAFPVGVLPLDMLAEILSGGAAKAAEAGIPVLGGHTIDDPVPKYGMVVTGVADPARLVRKSGARPGDRLVLTKPLGIGVLTTALDRGLASPETEQVVTSVMTQLNRAAAEAMQAVGVHACTDVSGFGLLGHLAEMASQSGLSARVSLSRVPVLPAAWPLVEQGAVSRGTRNNCRYLGRYVSWDAAVPEAGRLLLCDAQTSGGLLMAVPAQSLDALLGALTGAAVAAAVIGEMTAGNAGTILVTA